MTLKKKVSLLDEIVVESKEKELISYGRSRPYRLSGWYFSGIANGNEVGRLFENNKGIEFLDISFHVKSSEFDSILYRVNVQEISDNEYTSINKNELVIKSQKSEGWVKIDVSKERIITNNDFLISIELLKGWRKNERTNDGKIVYSAKGSGKKETYVRFHKFMAYDKFDMVLSMRVNAYPVKIK